MSASTNDYDDIELPNVENILDKDRETQRKWWNDFVAYYSDWYYLTEKAPALMTTAYAKLIVNDEVPASKQVKLACERHLKDLERVDDDNFGWYFDEQAAYRPIRFIEEKIKPSKGDFSKMVMQPFQHFILGSLFGWKDKHTHKRRFTQALIFMARKNGKTALNSGVAAYMTGFDGERGAEVYALANSQKQSRLLFEETSAMIKASPYLSERFKNNRSEIIFPRTNGRFEALSAEKNTKDGYNTHFAVFDEIHEYKDYDLINVMYNSISQRTQPMIMYITTAGYVLDGPLVDKFTEGTRCLENYDDMLNEQVFYYLAKLDDEEEVNDPLTWIKANPNLPMMNGLQMLTDYKNARNTPSTKADWLTKRFNLFSETGEESFLPNDVILENAKNTYDENDLLGQPCVAGYDLSDTEDFTAAALEFKLPNGQVYFKVHSWIPQKRVDREPDKRSIFKKWQDLGELTVCDGAYVDHSLVFDWLLEQDKLYEVRQVNYDPAKAIVLNEMLKDYGFKTEIIRQGFKTLGGPMQNIKELFLDNKVVFNNHAMFKWYLSNVALVTDRNNNWLPTKNSKNRKIDGFAAALNAHVTIAPELGTTESDGPLVSFVSLDEFM